MKTTIVEKLEFNKVYEIDLGDLSHGGMSHEEMIAHYKGNSSPLSFIMEKILEKMFPNDLVYDHSQEKIPFKNREICIRPDLRDLLTRTVLFDQKAFNDKGGSYSRSKNKGAGRKHDQEENDAWVKAQNFIWTDFTNLPKVRVIVLTGEDILERFPHKNGKISFKKREELFS